MNRYVKQFLFNIKGDTTGGISAMLVSLPSTIAYGLMSYAPLGAKFAGMAALGAIIGSVGFNFVTSVVKGNKVLTSGPNAAAAAVLSVFVAELVRKANISPEAIPTYVSALVLFSAAVQILVANLGGGKFIKYIPYPVITGYLYGVAVLLFLGQLPKFLGLPKGVKLAEGLFAPSLWRWENVLIGSVSIVVMLLSKKYAKKIPSAIVALTFGITTYFILALYNPSMLSLKNNPFVIGEIATDSAEITRVIVSRWQMLSMVNLDTLVSVIVPGLTLALLLSVTSLNTCIVLDGLTYSNHDPKRELVIQGLGNTTAALLGGIPAAGVMTATLENINNGGKTKKSLFINGLSTLLILLFVGKFIGWIPIGALAGILIIISIRLIDFKVLGMLKNKSTVFDFFVIITVIVAAANLDLIKAAGVGIGVAIFLFLREQMAVSVIRRKIFGNQVFSKKIRPNSERKILEEKGGQAVIIELQGQLFFGTTDQLFSKLEPYYAQCKFVVLDMRRIQSVDYTAANMLKKILARVVEKGSYLIFTSLPQVLPTGQNVRAYFLQLGLGEGPNLKIFDDMDAGLLWIEDRILISERVITYDENKVLELGELDLFDHFPEEALQNLNECIETKDYGPNQTIFKGGDTGDEIYFVRKGNVKIVLSLADGKYFHLLTIGMGSVFGEMAFIDNVSRSADAISVDDTSLYFLSRKKFNQVTQVHPEIAGLLFERLALLIANRLRQSNKELKVFQEN
jgi:sulfate permease, SulP family